MSMAKRISAFLLALVLALALCACAVQEADAPSSVPSAQPSAAATREPAVPPETQSPTAETDEPSVPAETAPAVSEDGRYNSKEEVALYLHLYGHLPDNYVTKNEARASGWTGGSVEPYTGAGTAIGGDRFGNNEGLLPEAKGRSWQECDIDTVGRSSRGTKRLVFSNDGLIYYTEDHYNNFELLYGGP